MCNKFNRCKIKSCHVKSSWSMSSQVKSNPTYPCVVHSTLPQIKFILTTENGATSIDRKICLINCRIKPDVSRKYYFSSLSQLEELDICIIMIRSEIKHFTMWIMSGAFHILQPLDVSTPRNSEMYLPAAYFGSSFTWNKLKSVIKKWPCLFQMNSDIPKSSKLRNPSPDLALALA